METSLNLVISWTNIFSFHEITWAEYQKVLICIHVISWNKKTSKGTDTFSHVWVIYEVKICEKKGKILYWEKKCVAKREKKNGKSIKFKRGWNVSRKSETFPCPVW